MAFPPPLALNAGGFDHALFRTAAKRGAQNGLWGSLMMNKSARRRSSCAAFLSVAILGISVLSGGPAAAGAVGEGATEAESLLAAGKSAEALAAFDEAAAAFWVASPLQFRVVSFADSVKGFADYQPREAKFKKGETVLLYLEPFGFGFAPGGTGFRSAIAADVELRTPGGLILGKADNFARLEWTGQTKMHEVHATLTMTVPDLKPGDYELMIRLTDQLAPKSATLELPFTVVE